MNFLRPTRNKSKRRGRTIGVLATAVVILIAAGALLLRAPLISIYGDAIAGRTAFLDAQAAIREQRFTDARADLATASERFSSAKSSAASLKAISWLPILGRQIKAVTNLLDVGLQAGRAAQSLTAVAERVTEPLRQDGNVTFASISPAEKRSVLELVSQSEPDIQGAKADIDLAILFLDDIPKHGLLPPLASAIKPLREQLPKMQQSLAMALPAVRVVPNFVGYPKERTYLFLLQNNNELRPTGGFIGTYGVLKLKDGEVSSLKTDNIYNLDVKSEDFLDLEPPEPLQKYLKATQWFMRDANWSPDFPTAAERVLATYDLETQSRHDFQGVMAITPTFIQNLMELTGSITVDGVTFTKENLIDQLQYQVERAFVAKGVSDADRKDIIGDMTEVLFDRLLTLPKEKWGRLATILQDSTAEKHFLLYLLDDEPQRLVRDQGWGGEVRQSDGDSFLVVDANLASLKTDQALERSIDYRVEPDGDDLVARLSIRYVHNGSFDWKTTRYRTYTRVYVPQGSVLRSQKGFLENDKLSGAKPGEVATYDDSDKTVFAGFTSIEPKEERTLELVYVLPDRLAERFRDGSYELLAQKQSGTIAHALTLDVRAPGRIQSYTPDGNPNVDGSTIRYQTELRRDRQFRIIFRP